MTRLRIRDVFSRRYRVSALFSALPAISAARRLSHSTGTKIPATNYTFFYRYFRAEYRYPHGTAVPVWTPSNGAFLDSKLTITNSSVGTFLVVQQSPTIVLVHF